MTKEQINTTIRVNTRTNDNINRQQAVHINTKKEIKKIQMKSECVDC